MREKHDALTQTVYNSRWQGQLMGWLASLYPGERGEKGIGSTSGSLGV